MTGVVATTVFARLAARSEREIDVPDAEGSILVSGDEPENVALPEPQNVAALMIQCRTTDVHRLTD